VPSSQPLLVPEVPVVEPLLALVPVLAAPLSLEPLLLLDDDDDALLLSLEPELLALDDDALLELPLLDDDDDDDDDDALLLELVLPTVELDADAVEPPIVLVVPLDELCEWLDVEPEPGAMGSTLLRQPASARHPISKPSRFMRAPRGFSQSSGTRGASIELIFAG